MYQVNEFESAIASQRSSLQGKVAKVTHKEREFDFEPRLEREAWLSRRLNYIRTYRSTDEFLELRQTTQEDTSEMVRWGSVFGVNLGTCMMQKNLVYIDMPSDDWSWCADPL
jgi:hypothetical protein